MIGRTLDRYRIESTLGESGMGVVDLARDTQLDWSIALKVLPSDKAVDAARKTARRAASEPHSQAQAAERHKQAVPVADVDSSLTSGEISEDVAQACHRSPSTSQGTH